MLLTKKSEYALLSLISIAKSEEPKNVDELSRELNIEMPITETIYKVLYEDEKVENVIKQIMLREFKSEQEF